jgi:O-antigen ligase
MRNLSTDLVEGNPIDRIVFFGLVAIGLLILIFRWDRTMRILQNHIPIVIFLVYCLVSLTWSQYADVAFKRWIKTLGDFVMVLIVVSDSNPMLALRSLFSRLAYLLLPLSILLIKYYPVYGREYGRWTGQTYYSGVTSGKNELGCLCMLIGLAVVWRLLHSYNAPHSKYRSQQLALHCFILSMVLWLFWLAHSMTSLGCFVIGCACFLFIESRKARRSPMLVPCVVIGILVVFTSILIVGVLPGILEAIGKDPSLTDRKGVWETLIPLMSNPIIGTGFESYWLGPRLDKIWAVWWWQPIEAHNGYLEIYLSLGWVGVFLLLSVLIHGYRGAVRNWRYRAPASSLMLTYYIVGLAYNFTESALFRMMHPVWLVLLLSMTYSPMRSLITLKSDVQDDLNPQAVINASMFKGRTA